MDGGPRLLNKTLISSGEVLYMLRIKYFSMVWILMLASGYSLIAQNTLPDSLTLRETVAIALQNNPAIQQAEEGTAASRAKVGEARSSLYPMVNGEASYSRVGPVPTLSFPGFGSFSLFPENNYDAHVGVSYEVYDFGRRESAVNVAGAAVKSSEHRVFSVKFGLAYQTVRTFYTILYLQKNINVLDEQIYDLNQHLQVTQKKVKAGTAIDYDVLSTQVRVEAARSNREDVRNALQKQDIYLRRLLNIRNDEPLHLKGDITVNPVSMNVDSLIILAEQQRPDYQLAMDARSTAVLQEKLAARGKMPAVNLQLSYGVKNGYIPNLDALRGNWVAGLQLEVPIFQGHRTRFQREAAQAQIKAADAALEEVRNHILADVKQSVSEVQSKLEKLKTSRLQLEQAEQARSMAETQYNVGVISNLDLLDAQTQLTEARFMHLRSRYEYVMSRYSLEQAMGAKFWNVSTGQIQQ